MKGFMHYLACVPHTIEIAGLDRDRWVIVMPAWRDTPGSVCPISADQAAWMYAEAHFSIAMPYSDSEVREELEWIAKSERNLRRLAEAVAEAA